MFTISTQFVKSKLALIIAGTALAVGAAATPVLAKNRTPAQRLCNVQSGKPAVCTIYVNAQNGVTIYSGAGFHCKKLGSLPRGYDANVRVTKSSREWLKLSDRPGWIHYRNLTRAGD